MDNKILFEETFKTFDEKRRTRFLSCDDPEAWAEDDVTTLMYDVAITARDTVLNELLERLKSSLTDEQLKPVFDVIPEFFDKNAKVKPTIDKETIKTHHDYNKKPEDSVDKSVETENQNPETQKMALYSIYNDTCLGWSHSGPVNVESDGFVELSDEEVTKIVELIRKEGTSDIEELKLEEVYPDIYKKLNDAFYKMAYDAEEKHWLMEGFLCGYYEYDSDELMAYCAENCGFNFEYDEEDYITDGELDEDALYDAKNDYFDDWLKDYVSSLDEEDAIKFLKEHMNADVNLYDDEITYEITIPEAIIKMAEKKE